jgi:hypothetical protein
MKASGFGGGEEAATGEEWRDGTDSVVMIGDGRSRRVVMLNIEGEVEGEDSEATEGV